MCSAGRESSALRLIRRAIPQSRQRLLPLFSPLPTKTALRLLRLRVQPLPRLFPKRKAPLPKAQRKAPRQRARRFLFRYPRKPPQRRPKQQQKNRRPKRRPQKSLLLPSRRWFIPTSFLKRTAKRNVNRRRFHLPQMRLLSARRAITVLQAKRIPGTAEL